jgi:hypothetical protein
MKVIVVVAIVSIVFFVSGGAVALASGLSNGNAGGSTCLGLGYLGPSVGVAGVCENGVPVPAKQPSGTQKAGGTGRHSGDYWAPIGASVSNAGYGQCPKGSIPTYIQEYNAQGQPIGQPEAVCPAPQPQVPVTTPPPPPAPQAVWAETPLPAATLETNPGALGLAQLPTLFWVKGVGQGVTSSVEIEGYELSVSARPREFLWSFGDGGTAQSTSAGGPQGPSVVHTYTEPGTYRVTLTVVYSGQMTYSGPGGEGSEALPNYGAGPYSEDYTVQQVRSLLVVPAGT